MPRKKPIRLRIAQALPDDVLVRRVLAGETELFEVLLHRHSQRVYRAARAILGDDGEAADVVQETFVRAYRNLGQFAGRAKFTTWVTKIGVHEARTRLRRQRARGVPIRELGATGESVVDESATESDPERRAFAGEVRKILEAAIDALPDLYRTVFVMRELEEMSTAETAECLNLTEDAVKTRLRRARALVRRTLRASPGKLGREAFHFAGERCQRMWDETIGPRIRKLRRPETRPNAKSP